jgi:hypothetical protein
MMAMQRAAASSLEKQIVELEGAEREFFAYFGLPREETSVTRLAASLKETLHNRSFESGKRTILDYPSGDYIPRLNMSNLEVLFRDQAGAK